MQIAARMDWSRPHAIGTEGRIFALMLASGIAGLSITYPTVTVGNGTAGEWTGKFDVKPAHLTMPALSPDMSITAKFRDSGQIITAAVNAGAAGLSDLSGTLAPEIRSLAGAAKTTDRGATTARSPVLVERSSSGAQLGPSKPVMQSSGSIAGIKAVSPVHSTERVNVEPAAPLDAVRIALPPASKDLGGALPPEATLGRLATLDHHGSPAPGSSPATQALAASVSPEALIVSAPGTLPDAQPPNLFPAPREVREFDLAKLGSAKPAVQALARSSGNALAPTAKAAGHPRNLSKIAKGPDRIVGDHIIHVAGLSLEDVPSGNLPVRIGMTGELSVKLADLLIPVQNQIAPDAFQRLAASSAASEYVSFADLRAAGFEVRYNAGDDRLMVSALHTGSLCCTDPDARHITSR